MASRDAPRVIVLYEDSRDVSNRFALHDLVMTRVADVSGLPFAAVRPRAKEVPAKGVNKIASYLDDRFARFGQQLLCVVDGDRAFRGLGCDDTDSAILQALRARASVPPQQVEVFVVRLPPPTRSNTEGIIAVVRRAAPALVAEAVFIAAERGRPKDRDDIFDAMCRAPAAVREVVFQEVGALGRLVTRLCLLVA